MTPALLFAAGLSSLHCGAVGQSVAGRVLDASTRAPVAAALITVVDSAGREYGRLFTDSSGVFRFARLTTRGSILHVERLGYTSFENALRLELHELLTVDVLLTAQGLPAAPLVVTARRVIRDPRLAEFYQRMHVQERTGFGQFLHREQLDSVALPSLTDYLQRYARVPVQGAGTNAVVPGRGSCGRVQLFVDGVKNDLPINAVPVGVVEGVEVYRSKAELPIEYSYGEAANCGAMLVWTRSGASRGRANFLHKVLIVALAVSLSLVPIMDLR
ncbi:MAG TPA: carboxypeptidase-like regulatory domain-containing protein [Longimicrobiales bacterium]|nr:carboxypeptidase-like regulatory domain-containing protein [Longimicrobiales bacterium]